MITFIYKNGFTNGIGDAKMKFKKNRKKTDGEGGGSGSNLPSNHSDRNATWSSNSSDTTCGDRLSTNT